MNCTRYDVAQVVRAIDDTWALGQIVRVIYLAHEPESWWLEVPLQAPDGTLRLKAEDRCLRPIRDPGDDAIDESKAWLPPVPTIDPSLLPTKETA